MIGSNIIANARQDIAVVPQTISNNRNQIAFSFSRSFLYNVLVRKWIQIRLTLLSAHLEAGTL